MYLHIIKMSTVHTAKHESVIIPVFELGPPLALLLSANRLHQTRAEPMRSTFTRPKKVSIQELIIMLLSPLASQGLFPSSFPSSSSMYVSLTSPSQSGSLLTFFLPTQLMSESLTSFNDTNLSICHTSMYKTPHHTPYVTLRRPPPSISSVLLFAAHPTSYVYAKFQVLPIRHSSYLYCFYKGTPLARLSA
jgi:hypothetical protein